MNLPLLFHLFQLSSRIPVFWYYIPVIVPFVFQSCHLLFLSGIPLTVSLIPLFLFQYPNVSFSQFLSCLFLCFSFQYSSPYFFRTRSMLRLLSVARFSIVFHYHAAYLTFFAVSSICLRRHLWHWTRNPWIDSSPSTFRRSFPVLYQHILTFHSTL